MGYQSNLSNYDAEMSGSLYRAALLLAGGCHIEMIRNRKEEKGLEKMVELDFPNKKHFSL